MRIILAVILGFFSLYASASPQFLTLSDFHYGSDNKTQKGRDIGPEFLKITLTQFQSLHKNVDFILMLGDLPAHSLFNNPKKEEFEKAVFEGLYQANNEAKPMFYITGNNDSLAGNYQPFETQGKSPLTYAEHWSGACAHCEGLTIDDSQMRKYGYYTTYVIPGNKELLLIALNSTQFIKSSIFSPKYPNKEDGEQQLVWLEQQLKGLHAKQLLIAMHIPPGSAYNGTLFWQESFTQQFIKLLEKYQTSYKQITLLTAHTHMDEIRKIRLQNGRNIYLYSTPSISLNHHNNPGIKQFSLDSNFAIKNYITYYTEDLNAWATNQYQALGTSKSIFPHCDTKNLGQCLDSLSLEQVCDYLEQNLFYGVKSARVPQQVCHRTYQVN